MRTDKTLYLETTTVPAERTIGDITALLVRAGAREIMTTYEAGQPSGVRWAMEIYNRRVWFQMPVKVDAVYRILRKKRKNVTQSQLPALQHQARRVAWRQLLSWTQVQIAMVQIEMAEFAQVFLPYVMDSSERTMWDVMKETQFKQIEAPKQ